MEDNSMPRGPRVLRSGLISGVLLAYSNWPERDAKGLTAVEKELISGDTCILLEEILIL
jgi:hypothetical protein